MPILSISQCRHLLYQSSGRWLSSILWRKYSDFRPVSVTPILSRLTEREIVRRYMYPAFEDKATYNLLEDQYAFRPTGSMTSALISIQQQTIQMLKDNEYVAIVSLDLAKAFAMVCHDTLCQEVSSHLYS